MGKLTFKNIVDCLEDNFDPSERARLFDVLLSMETDDASILGARQFLIDNQFDHVALRNFLNENRTNIDKKRFTIKPNFILRVAAVFIGLVIFGYWMLFRQSNFDLTPYESVEQGLPVMMSEASNKSFSDAMSRFKQKEYSSSITLLSECPISDTTLYYIGICNYFNEDYEIAELQLKLINMDSEFAQKSKYYQALALIQQKKYTSARELFEQINDPELLVLSKELLANLPNN